MEEIVRLRGHHILCLLGFRGLGYSDEFVENMARVHARVFSDKALVEIVAGADSICDACPRLANGKCGKARHKDATILSLLSLQPEDRLEPDEIYLRVAEAITPENLSNICARCRWLSLGYCAEGLSGIRSNG